MAATRALKDAIATISRSLTTDVAAEVATNLADAAAVVASTVKDASAVTVEAAASLADTSAEVAVNLSDASAVVVDKVYKAASQKAPSKRDLRAAQTRADVLGAAARLVARQGYEATSLDAIAKEAGYTKGAIYAHFSSKDALFDELIKIFAESSAMAFADPRGLVEPPEWTQPDPSAGVDENLLLNLECRLYALRHPEKAAPITYLAATQLRQLARQVHFDRTGEIAEPNQSDLDAAMGLLSITGEGGIWAQLLPPEMDIKGAQSRLANTLIASPTHDPPATTRPSSRSAVRN